MSTGPATYPQNAAAVAGSPRRYSYDEVVAEFPETNQPAELNDGDLVMSPAPSFLHQEVVLRFYDAIKSWVAKRTLGKVVTSPIDMVLSAHQVTQPDVLFIARERLDIVRRAIMGPADLVAEVVSLGTRNRDRIEKRDLYEQYGIKEYWIIDPEPQTIEVFTLENRRYELAGRWRPGQTAQSRFLAGFAVPVAPLFEDLIGQP